MEAANKYLNTRLVEQVTSYCMYNDKRVSGTVDAEDQVNYFCASIGQLMFVQYILYKEDLTMCHNATRMQVCTCTEIASNCFD